MHKLRLNFLMAVLFFGLPTSTLTAAFDPMKCGLDLNIIAQVKFKKQRGLLGGDIPRRAVEQFSQKDKSVSLKRSVEMVATWLQEYYRYADRMEAMAVGLEKTQVRLKLLETEWLTYQKKPAYRFKIPNGVSVDEDDVTPIEDPQGTSVYIGSKSDALKHYKDELNTKNNILILMEKEMKAQAVRHYRFEIILRNRGESLNFEIDDNIKGISRTRLELIRDIQAVMDPNQPYAAEMHPPRALLLWVKTLAREDSARRRLMRKYYLDTPTRVWSWLSDRSSALDEKRKKKLMPILFVSGSIATASLLMTQMNMIRTQTQEIVQQIEEKSKTPEQIKKALEEKQKAEKEKKLLEEAKKIAENTNTWKELRDSFISFTGNFPAEATKIFAEYHLGKRKDLEPDGKTDPFYFIVAKEIETWWSRIYDGYSKDGVELIYGAKGRAGIKTEAAELLEAFFENLENPPPPELPASSPKKPKKPS